MSYFYSWLILAFAIAAEVLGTTCLKLSNGMTKLYPVIGVGTFYVLTFVLLSISLRRLELGVSYAVWSGVGTTIIAIIGIIFFQESTSPLKFILIGLIILSVVGLYMIGK